MLETLVHTGVGSMPSQRVMAVDVPDALWTPARRRASRSDLTVLRKGYHSFRMEITATVASLKERLNEYRGHVKAGREVVVTEHGLPVARLTAIETAGRPVNPSVQSIPAAGAESLFLEPAEQGTSRRDRLARAGALKLGRGSARAELLTPPSGEPFGDRILAALLADRTGA